MNWVRRNRRDSGSGSSSNAHTSWERCKLKFAMGQGSVRSVAVDPSDTYVYTGLDNGTIKIWDISLEDRNEKLKLTAHAGQVRGLAFDRKKPALLFSVDDDPYDNSVKMWDISTNQVIRSHHGHDSGIYSVTFHPTFPVLFTGGGDSVIKGWDMRSPTPLAHELIGHADKVSSLFGRPMDPHVISGSHDSTIKLWDVRNAASTTLTDHNKSVWAMAPHPTDDCFVSASADNLKKFQLPRGEFMQNMLSSQNTIINSVAVNEEGDLVTAGDNGSLWFWDWTRGHSFQQSMAGVPFALDGPRRHSITFDNTGLRLFACGHHWMEMWTKGG